MLQLQLCAHCRKLVALWPCWQPPGTCLVPQDLGAPVTPGGLCIFLSAGCRPVVATHQCPDPRVLLALCTVGRAHSCFVTKAPNPAQAG